MGPRRRGGPHLTSDVIYERKRGGTRGRETGEPGTVAGVGIDGSFSFSLLPGYIVLKGPREGSIKIISDALMRNYEELSSFFIFAGTSYSVRYHSFMNARRFKLQRVIEIHFLALFVRRAVVRDVIRYKIFMLNGIIPYWQKSFVSTVIVNRVQQFS